MVNMKRWTGGAILALACGAAGAGMHQICYEGPPQQQGSNFVPNGIFGCAIDGGGSCTISPVSNGFLSRSAWPLNQGVQSGGTFAYYDFSSSSGTFSAKVQFFDSNGVKQAERFCTVVAQGVLLGTRGHASPGAVLTGFSTDASGLVTSGVWRLQSTTDAPWRRLYVQAPGDFVSVGGGAMGVEGPNGAVLIESMRYLNYPGDERGWRASTTEAGGAAQPHRTTAYVVGMHVEGLSTSSLAALLQSTTATSFPAIAALASTQVTQPVIGGSAILSGGFQAWADSSNALNMIGQLGTVNAPAIGKAFKCTQTPTGIFRCTAVSAVTGWRVESKDHVIPHPGWINTQMLALPLTLTINGVTWEVRSGYAAATSAVTAHPAVDVSGLRGDYALTGVGATVDWKRLDQFGNQVAAGNLLWKMEPRADLGGASVAAKDHLISSPASITGYALGIKLVPAGTP